MLFQDVEKSIYGVGRKSFLGAQRADSIKRTVENTVAVDYKYSFHTVMLRDTAGCPFYKNAEKQETSAYNSI